MIKHTLVFFFSTELSKRLEQQCQNIRLRGHAFGICEKVDRFWTMEAFLDHVEKLRHAVELLLIKCVVKLHSNDPHEIKLGCMWPMMKREFNISAQEYRIKCGTVSETCLSPAEGISRSMDFRLIAAGC